jgi:hypothetical protein
MEHHPQSVQKGSKWIHRAWVVKDRTDVLDGQFFDNPTIDSFMPHIKCLNLKGEHKVIETKKTTEGMFERGDTGYDRFKKKDRLLDRIKVEVESVYPGRTDQAVQDRRELSRSIFDTPSFKEIEAMSLEALEKGLKAILDFRAEISTDKEKKA